MVKVTTGTYAGSTGYLILDNEYMSVYDERTQIWVTLPIACGYELA